MQTQFKYKEGQQAEIQKHNDAMCRTMTWDFQQEIYSHITSFNIRSAADLDTMPDKQRVRLLEFIADANTLNAVANRCWDIQPKYDKAPGVQRMQLVASIKIAFETMQINYK